jgi:hypothetical protein
MFTQVDVKLDKVLSNDFEKSYAGVVGVIASSYP